MYGAWHDRLLRLRGPGPAEHRDHCVSRPESHLSTRVARLEDEQAIRRIVLSYGPAADAGLARAAAALWSEEGHYDWGSDRGPHRNRREIETMLSGDAHRSLIDSGVAHFSGPPLIDVDGNRGTALTYSLVMRRDPESARFYLWRLSAVRWELERDGASWAIRKRTNRMLDETGAGRDLLYETLSSLEGWEER